MQYVEIKSFSRKLRREQTAFERRLWYRIRNRQLEGFRFLRQRPLMYHRQGNDLKFFIPDFYCPKARLVIELDGGIHDETPEKDQWRDEILRGLDMTNIPEQSVLASNETPCELIPGISSM